MAYIYHITTLHNWQQAQQAGFYEAPSLKEEGFIHCSQESQLAAVLNRYYAGKTGLVKLIIDPERLTSELVYEWSPSVQDTFPHVYGTINLEAVVEVIYLP